jgi:hypothetical protein
VVPHPPTVGASCCRPVARACDLHIRNLARMRGAQRGRVSGRSPWSPPGQPGRNSAAGPCGPCDRHTPSPPSPSPPSPASPWVSARGDSPISRSGYPDTPRRSRARAGGFYIAGERGAGAAGAPRPDAQSAARGPRTPTAGRRSRRPRPVRPRGPRPVGALLHPGRLAQRSRRNRARPRNLVAARRRVAQAPSLGGVGARPVAWVRGPPRPRPYDVPHFPKAP